MAEDLKKLVYDALDDSQANGHDPLNSDPSRVAEDMWELYPWEGEPPEDSGELVPFVRSWQAARA